MDLKENFSLSNFIYQRGTALKKLELFRNALVSNHVSESGPSEIIDGHYFTIEIYSIVLKFETWLYIDSNDYFSEIVCKRIITTPEYKEFLVGSIKVNSSDQSNLTINGHYAPIDRYAPLVVDNFLEKALSKEAFEFLSRPKP